MHLAYVTTTDRGATDRLLSAVAERLQVKLSQVYFAKYTISRLIRKEVRALESQLF